MLFTLAAAIELVAIVTVGLDVNASLPVKVSVITSPTLALVLDALFDTMDTTVNVGTDLSKVTAVELVVAVTDVPALPDKSLKLIVKGTFPVASPDTIV